MTISSKDFINETTKARQAELLSSIASYRAVAEYSDDELGKWMTSKHKIQTILKKKSQLPGRFKRMLDKGTAKLDVPPDLVPDTATIQRFREGVRKQIEEWETELKNPMVQIAP